MRGCPADDKQRSIGVLIRKQFIVFPVETPLSPDLIGTLKVIKSLGTSQSDLGSMGRNHIAQQDRCLTVNMKIKEMEHGSCD